MLTFALVLVLLLPACRQHAAQAFDPAVIATVNGESVSRTDFIHELSRELVTDEGDEPSTPEQVEPMKKALLDTVIERTLLLQAARANNVSVAPDEVDREVLRIGADFPADGFNEALSEGQLSVTELKQKTGTLLTIQKLFDSTVYPRVGITEEDIRSYFEAHEKEFQEPEQVRAEQIVVKTMDEAKVVQSQLRAGKKFGDLARKYSLSADAKVGGDLGYFARGTMPPEFDEVAFRLSPGQTSDIVTTEYGFHLFKVLEKRPARRRDLSQARNEVEKKLLAAKREQAQKDFIKGLRERAKIQVNEPGLQAITADVLHPAKTQTARQ